MPIKPKAYFAGIGILLPKAVVNNPSVVLRSHRNRQAGSLVPGLEQDGSQATGGIYIHFPPLTSLDER